MTSGRAALPGTRVRVLASASRSSTAVVSHAEGWGGLGASNMVPGDEPPVDDLLHHHRPPAVPHEPPTDRDRAPVGGVEDGERVPLRDVLAEPVAGERGPEVVREYGTLAHRVHP